MAGIYDSLLKIADSLVLQQFLHDCVDDLVGTKQANFDSYNSDIQWTAEDFHKTKHNVQKLFRQSAVGGNYCETQSDLSESIQQKFKDCFEIRKDEIVQALVKEKLIQNGHNVVDNVDWKLKWILGSSTLASIKEPLLQVDLHCTKKGPSDDKLVRETVNFEVNLESLDQLIHQLEHVNNKIKQN